MIIVSGRLPIRPDAHDAAREAVGPLLEGTRAEGGCLRYDFAFDVEDDNVVHFVEVWETQEALQAHFQAPHFQAFNQAAAGFVAGAPQITFYDATEIEMPRG